LSGIEKREIMERKHEKYERLIARCKAMAPIPTAVAHPCDESSLRGAVEAAEMGILNRFWSARGTRSKPWRHSFISTYQSTK
jgi:hypothetical protein